MINTFLKQYVDYYFWIALRKFIALYDLIVNEILIIASVFIAYIKNRRLHFTPTEKIKHILVVRVDDIGDIIIATPFLRELRRNFPDSEITLIVAQSTYHLVERCPYVDKILIFNRNVSGLFTSIRLYYRILSFSRKYFQHERYDLALSPRWTHDHNYGPLLLYLSGSPFRLGYSGKGKGRLIQQWDALFTHLVQDFKIRHEVEYELEIIRFLGGKIGDSALELWLSEEDEQFAINFLKSCKIKSGSLLIALAPGAAERKRQWPLLNFTELGSWLVQEYNARILLVGGPKEISVGLKLQEKIGDSVINMIGKTTLRQTCALLKQCHLFIGNDSGPLHMAAAAKMKIIEISSQPIPGIAWSGNSPKRFGAWGGSPVVLQPERGLHSCRSSCRSNKSHCIAQISVEQVKQAAAMLLKNPR